MAVFDGDYEYVRAGGVDLSYRQLPDTLSHVEYKTIAKSFRASINRVISVWALPLQLIFWSSVICQTKYLSRFRCGINPEDESRDDEDIVKVAAGAVYAEIIDTDVGAKARDVGSSVLDSLVGDQDDPGVPQAKDGIEAVMASMVMASYAAFETLAADLWIAAVNRHHALATNWIEKNSERQLPANVIAGYQYDIASRMGTILHDTKKVTFESLNDIRTAYNQTFKAELNGAFEPIGDLIKAEKTRHLFAHRGGFIDQKFKSDTNEFPEYASIKIGDRLRLTGPVTSSHVVACVKCGIELLKQMDNWSAMHK